MVNNEFNKPSNEQQIEIDTLIDPPRFEDSIANAIFKYALRLCSTPFAKVNIETFAHSGFHLYGEGNHRRTYFASLGFANFFRTITKRRDISDIAARILAYPNARDTDSLSFDLKTSAALIVYYLSSSNWSCVYPHIKDKLINPNSPAGITTKESTSEVDLAELRMIGFVRPNARQLASVLVDLNARIQKFDKTVMAVSVVAIRQMIWNWIESFPLEFSKMCLEKKNLDGFPDGLFAFFQNNADSPRKKNLYWPTQCMLLLLSGEDLHMYTTTGSSAQSVTMKAQFLELLRKQMKSKSADISLLCFTDVCRAATFINKSAGSTIRILIDSFESDLKQKLFDNNKPVVYTVDDGGIIDEAFVIDALTSIYKLNPTNILQNWIVPLFESSVSSGYYRMLALKAFYILVNEAAPFPWCPTIDVLLAQLIRKFFMEFVTREKQQDPKKKRVAISNDKAAKKQQAEDQEKSEIVQAILACWSACPALLVAHDKASLAPGELRIIIQNISFFRQDPSVSIRFQAGHCLLRLFDPPFMPYLDGTQRNWQKTVNDPSLAISPSEISVSLFWQQTSIPLILISKNILDVFSNPDLDSDYIKESLALMCDLLNARNRYLKSKYHHVPLNTQGMHQERYAACVIMEIALSMLLCFFDPWVSRVAALCLEQMLLEARITAENIASPSGIPRSSFGSIQSPPVVILPPQVRELSIDGGRRISRAISANGDDGFSELPFVLNLKSYTHIVDAFDRFNLISNKVQQKKLRSALLFTEHSTPGNVGAWEEVYKRWKQSTAYIVKNQTSSFLSVDKGVGSNNQDDEDSKSGRLTATMKRLRVTQVTGYSNSKLSTVSGPEYFADDFAVWQNFTGFLCALANTCMSASMDAAPTPSNANAFLLPKPMDGSDVTGRSSSVKAAPRSPTLSDKFSKTPQTISGADDGSDTISSIDNLADAMVWVGLHPSVGWTQMCRPIIANSLNKAQGIVEMFVKELVELLLLKDNLAVRETIRDVLSYDVSGAVYITLYGNFEKLLTQIISQTNFSVVSERNTIAFDMIISISRSVLDRAEMLFIPSHVMSPIGTPVLPNNIATIMPNEINFARIILLLVRYMKHLSVTPGDVTVLARYKIRLCQLTEIFLRKQELVGIRDGPLFRNHMMKIMMEWNSEFEIAADKVAKPETVGIINLELDQTSMQTFSRLLDKTPLVLVNEVNCDLTQIPAESDNNPSKIFSTYLSFFLKVLKKCKTVESIDVNRQAMSSELRLLISKSEESAQLFASLRDNTIVAMSNLVSSNTKYGIKYALQIAYQEDLRSRTALIHVLTNILAGGSVAGFIDDQLPGGKYMKLLELVFHDDLHIVHLLCDTSSQADIDQIASPLFEIFNIYGKQELLVTKMIEDEIKKTTTAASIFRRNSIATKLMTLYAKNEAHDFLATVLQPIVRIATDTDAVLTFEVDPSRLPPNQDLQANMTNLTKITQEILNSIYSNAASFSPKLRRVCSLIVSLVREKFPGTELLAVGGFIFLRFICPAIASPKTHGIVKDAIQNSDLRRGFILITKVIQNLANNVRFGNKEQCMVYLNEFLDMNQPNIHEFLIDISSVPMGSEFIDDGADDQRWFEELEPFVGELHGYLIEHLPKMQRIITAAAKDTGAKIDALSSVPEKIGDVIEENSDSVFKEEKKSPQFKAERKEAVNRLSFILSHLGPVELKKDDTATLGEGSKRSTMLSSSLNVVTNSHTTASRIGGNTAYQEFMVQQSARLSKGTTLEFMKKKLVFYEAGASADNRPVLYYIASRVLTNAIDIEMLLHVMLESCVTTITKPFDVLVDLTFINPENEWTGELLRTFEKVLPVQAISNMHTIIFLHPNSYFRATTKRAPRIFNNRMASRIVFASKLSEIYPYIARHQLQLPKSMLALYEQQATTYSPVHLLSQKGQSTPITLSVTNDTLQALFGKKHDICGTFAYLIDIFRMSDIRDVGAITLDPKNAGQEFYVKFNDKVITASNPNTSDATLYFASSKRDEIILSIRSAVARCQLSKPPVATSMRDMGPRDVPGTLLNIALLNMSSEDAALRGASFDMLSAICSSFGFKTARNIHNARVPGIAIPFNSYDFVISISAHLAETEQSLTSEFLIEGIVCIPKLNRDLTNHVLRYISPWLDNLAQYAKPSDAFPMMQQVEAAKEKLIQILKMLISVTVKEPESFHVVQEKIWKVLGKHDEIVLIAFELFVDHSIKLPLGANETELLGNSLVSLASTNPAHIAGHLVNNLRQTLVSTTVNSTLHLTEQDEWKRIQILLRFIMMLSFDGRLCLERFLPDLFYCLVMVAGIGPHIIRRTVYSIVLNSVQILLTNPDLSESNSASLRLASEKLSDPICSKMFSIRGVTRASTISSTDKTFRDLSTLAFVFNTDAVNQSDKIIDLTVSELEFFVSVLNLIASNGTANASISTSWKSRWMSLASQSCAEESQVLQIRSFVTIGELAKEFFDLDLVHTTVLALKKALSNYDSTKALQVQGIVFCLCSSLYTSPVIENILFPLFWFGVGLMQTGSFTLYQSGLALLQVILRLIEENGTLGGSKLIAAILNTKFQLKDPISKFEQEVGIAFEDNLSFSLAYLLLKGLVSAQSKKITMNVLSSFLKVSSKQSSDSDEGNFSRHTLGCLLLLMPFSERLPALFVSAGILEDAGVDFSSAYSGHTNLLSISNTDLHMWLLYAVNALTFKNPASMVLTFSLLQYILSAKNISNKESLFIYRLLATMAETAPNEFYMTYGTWFPSLASTLISTKSVELSEAIHAITFSMSAITATYAMKKTELVEGLEKIGFRSLLEPLEPEELAEDVKQRRIGVLAQLVDAIDSFIDWKSI